MDIKNSITDHTEFSGRDDTSDSSAAEQHKAKAVSPEDAVRKIHLHFAKHSNSQASGLRSQAKRNPETSGVRVISSYP
ncbi:hypothetical protein PSTG_12562 [Puccinia striiformis f. sp. tritici PST-78]|uniref:Uncharacterized protein n=1 Tax=Puccinia striiformis f. sp. tritici PST-78 TaxID=1165861 RepID=A0A0L0V4C8_9BASI|nr:hypothetical protein PSTG_12562 [Puccinia striiformis f. sp. tritici PST-78]